jgi:hypothetical protein
MKRTGLRLAGVAAVCLAAAIGSASASAAASWHVAGSPLTGSSALESTTKIVKSPLLYANGGWNIQCTGITLKTASITAPAAGSIEHLVFTGCAATSPSRCSLKSTTIESQPLTMSAALGSKSPEDVVTLKPTTGTLFLEYKYAESEGGCPTGNHVTGKVELLLHAGQTEAAEQEFTFSEAPGELFGTLGGEFHIYAAAKMKLASAKAWSFH